MIHGDLGNKSEDSDWNILGNYILTCFHLATENVPVYRWIYTC